KMIFRFHLQSATRVVRNITDWVCTNSRSEWMFHVPWGVGTAGGSAASIQAPSRFPSPAVVDCSMIKNQSFRCEVQALSPDQFSYARAVVLRGRRIARGSRIFLGVFAVSRIARVLVA